MRFISIYILLLALVVAGCAGKQVLVNKKRNCKLVLHEDSTYAFKYPTFMGKEREKGTYKIENNSILLKRVVPNTYGSVVDCSSGYYFHPDTLVFSFRDLNDSAIAVTFTLNEDPTVFKTDQQGHLQLLYSELSSKKIISSDGKIHSMRISFKNKTYEIANTSFLPNPTTVEIKLNQFSGEKTATRYRKFRIDGDTIIVNGIDPKAIGINPNNRKLVKSKLP